MVGIVKVNLVIFGVVEVFDDVVVDFVVNGVDLMGLFVVVLFLMKDLGLIVVGWL